MNTSDRELLELAARAAGMDGTWTVGADFSVDPPRQAEAYWLSNEDGHWSAEWNPLTDDGDALRLAVRLRIEIYFFDGFSEVVAEHNTASFEAGREQYADDMNAATRRAIVRAAAEIGRSMV